ncbi:asparagine synthase-related protein [Haladaptatus sp. GCM10025707]|uniref:asparagine synthase-related protein n=1 Tax=unclassified Haladaptatus TaxID=2622732 RepID=UPI0023E8BB12|nr:MULTISPECIES: asparagine synthase-related protein [unclassified Haladaptatus]
MVGLRGVLGSGSLPTEMQSWEDRPESVSYDFDAPSVEFSLSVHELLAGEQPVSVDGHRTLWLWGDVYGHGGLAEYTPKPSGVDGPTYVARLLADHGHDILPALNGEFLIVIHDERADELKLITDRFASRSVYYTRPTADSFVFTSDIQALTAYPDFEAAFDLPKLYQYLQLRRVFGVETPLEGVTELQPASVTTIDLADLSLESRCYWRPHYDPVDKPFSYFVDTLAETLQDLFAEWTRDDLTYGTLLSGGADSRLIQATLDQPAIGFHNADWMSHEAEVAKRVAETAGDEFRLLERYDDHEARTLARTPRRANFSGWFDQAYFSEFEAEIVSSVDVLVTGLFADMLFDGESFETRSLSLGPVGTVPLPARESIDTIDDYLDAKLAESTDRLPYFTPKYSLRDELRTNIYWDGDGIVSHGVRYESLTDLAMYSDYYPFGGDTEAIFPRSLMHMRPVRTPLLDNRIFDLHQQIPMKYCARRNVVNAALDAVSPDLAAIPHARTGVPLSYAYPFEYIGGMITAFYRKHIHDRPTPAPHIDHSPWPNRTELLGAKWFAPDTFDRRADLIRALPFLDASGIEETYEAHLDGDDHMTLLYSLLTLLEMPVTEAVARSSSPDDSLTLGTGPNADREPSTPEGSP